MKKIAIISAVALATLSTSCRPLRGTVIETHRIMVVDSNSLMIEDPETGLFTPRRDTMYVIVKSKVTYFGKNKVSFQLSKKHI